MLKTALLLLTGPFHTVIESLGEYLTIARKNVVNRLYVKLEPQFKEPLVNVDSLYRSRLSSVVPLVYSKSSTVCRETDVRLLLLDFKKSESKYDRKINFDLVLTNSDADEKEIYNYVIQNYQCQCKNIVRIENVISDCEDSKEHSLFNVYKTVSLGGTFDRLHNGHKVLLSEALLRASEKLIVGVSEVTMIQKKVLWELIEPVEKRIEEVSNFLTEVNPNLYYEIVPITNPYGPTITNPDIDCLIVTTETKIGGEKVNIERQKRGMHELSMYVLDLVENDTHTADEDEKLSSSTNRMHLLGTLLHPVKKVPEHDQNKPYCLLLQGVSSNDKNNISGRFQALGVPVLCCDEITKAILNKDQNLLNELSKEISEDLLLSYVSNPFDLLVAISLFNKEKKDWLYDQIFSKMRSALLQVLEIYFNQGVKIILIKDSTLFEGSDLNIAFSEIWSTILPQNVTLKKIKEEYNLKEDNVALLKECLPSNEKYAKKSNRIFSCMWSEDAIQKQIDRAWADLKILKESFNKL